MNHDKMSRFIVIPLFAHNGEPAAFVKENNTQKYIEFRSWKDAVHFVQYCQLQTVQDLNILYKNWHQTYFDSDEEEFTGHYNEFRKSDFTPIIVCRGPTIEKGTDLESLSIWVKTKHNRDQAENSQSEEEYERKNRDSDESEGERESEGENEDSDSDSESDKDESEGESESEDSDSEFEDALQSFHDDIKNLLKESCDKKTVKEFSSVSLNKFSKYVYIELCKTKIKLNKISISKFMSRLVSDTDFLENKQIYNKLKAIINEHIFV